MPDFDLDTALAEPANAVPDEQVFANYHYAMTHSDERAIKAGALGVQEFQILCIVVCDHTGYAIAQLLSGRYFTCFGSLDFETAQLRDAMDWLRTVNSGRHQHARF